MGKLLTVMEQRPELRKALQVSPTADMTAEDSNWDIERVDDDSAAATNVSVSVSPHHIMLTKR